MKLAAIFALMGGVVMLASCGTQSGDDGVTAKKPPAAEEPVVQTERWDATDGLNDTCGTADFQKYLGKPVSDIPEADLPESARVLSPDTSATMDYVKGRLNILTTPSGKIIGFKCG